MSSRFRVVDNDQYESHSLASMMAEDIKRETRNVRAGWKILGAIAFVTFWYFVWAR